MRKLIVLAALLAGCQTQPTPITVVNNNTNNNTVTINLGQTVPSKDSSCSGISRLQITLPTEVSVAARDLAQVSLTPLGEDGKPRSAKCDEADGASWFYPTNAFILGDNSAFLTTIKGLLVGNYALTARVGDASGTVPVVIVP